MAKRNLEKSWDLGSNVPTCFLDILNQRGVSNEIAHRLAVQHESPQLILIKDKQVIYSASHHHIDVNSVKEKLLSV